MDAKEKGADRTRRTIAYWIFICLLYYFGVEALFKGPFVVFVQIIMLISLSILAYRLTMMNIIWPLIDKLVREREKKYREEPPEDEDKEDKEEEDEEEKDKNRL